MKLYNTMSKQKEEFVPLEEGMWAVQRFITLSISEMRDR